MAPPTSVKILSVEPDNAELGTVRVTYTDQDGAEYTASFFEGSDYKKIILGEA